MKKGFNGFGGGFQTGFTPKCKKCGERKLIGNTNGFPNMLGFKLKDGRTINLCQKCMIELGKLPEEEKGKFFDDLTK